MSLFQESIVRKHLAYIDQEVVEQAYIRFKEVYSANKIANIKIAKEEQYQEGFIKDIFGTVLGYSIFPEQPFNIQTEKKNVADSKKADGAIFQGEDVVGVIELKDNKTKSLDVVKDQAFGYKNNHKKCSYVITSNFHKLRFYVNDATEYEEFDLYNLDKESFKRFYLYLRKEGLLDKNIPKLLKQETKFHEENISKNLYKDYSTFKNNFFQNVVKNNPQFDKLLLFKKSQKFLDKVLFLLFAEDKGLVTTNSIVQIIEKWQDLKNDAFDTPKPLYDLVALFFNNLYLGKKDQKDNVLVPEFGGEIFAPDDVLDNLIVDDAILKDDLLKLSRYDFNTDVDVNILGHIFEHSLSEIEEVEAELKGEIADIKKGKRKRDGVFYTPKYITKYIVENTVGKYCSEKKNELNLDIDISIFEHQKDDGKLNAKGLALYESLNNYKTWLLGLKILDPACGSGAFLNQAVNYLAQEHQFVDDLIAELTNTPLRLFDTDLAILENNIYGVDINEESIEIAKLSLWLRTAKQGRKLSNLSKNIKCGNSLIDDPAYAGDKAINWQTEFPEVFENGGFDIVIGNPPYGAYFDEKSKSYLSKNYKTFQGNFEIYFFFIELLNKLVKQFGKVGYISPDTWINIPQAQILRDNILQTYGINTIVAFQYSVFSDASVNAIIFILTKEKLIENCEFINVIDNYGDIGSKSLVTQCSVSNWKKSNDKQFQIWQNETDIVIIKKMQKNSILGEKVLDVCQGIVPYSTENLTKEQVAQRIYHSTTKLSEEYGEWVQGRSLSRYGIDLSEREYLKYGEWLHRPRKNKYFTGNRILIQEITGGNPPRIRASSFNGILYHDPGIISCLNISHFRLEYLLAIINSKLISWYNLKTAPKGKRTTFPKVLISDIRRIPFAFSENEIQNTFSEKVILIQNINREFQDIIKKLQRNLERKFKLIDLSKKLQSWHLLSYSEFINELNKKNIKMTLGDEADWETYFIGESKKAKELKDQMEKTDKEIDQMVYQLYELDEDQIKIIESNLT